MLENAFLSLSLSKIPEVNVALKEPRISGIPRRLVAILSIAGKRFYHKYSRFLLRSRARSRARGRSQSEQTLPLSMQSCAARAVPTAVVDRLDHLTAVMWSITQLDDATADWTTLESSLNH